VVGILTIGAYLYIYAPDVEVVHVDMICPTCDKNSPQPPDTVREANTGAMLRVILKNSGTMGTDLIHDNLTVFTPGRLLTNKDELREVANPLADIVVGLGAQSTAVLVRPIGDTLAYVMRHPELSNFRDDPIYLFGHYTYRIPFFFPKTRKFCFEYVPPAKGVPEAWAPCSF